METSKPQKMSHHMDEDEREEIQLRRARENQDDGPLNLVVVKETTGQPVIDSDKESVGRSDTKKTNQAENTETDKENSPSTCVADTQKNLHEAIMVGEKVDEASGQASTTTTTCTEGNDSTPNDITKTTGKCNSKEDSTKEHPATAASNLRMDGDKGRQIVDNPAIENLSKALLISKKPSPTPKQSVPKKKSGDVAATPSIIRYPIIVKPPIGKKPPSPLTKKANRENNGDAVTAQSSKVNMDPPMGPFSRAQLAAVFKKKSNSKGKGAANSHQLVAASSSLNVSSPAKRAIQKKKGTTVNNPVNEDSTSHPSVLCSIPVSNLVSSNLLLAKAAALKNPPTTTSIPSRPRRSTATTSKTSRPRRSTATTSSAKQKTRKMEESSSESGGDSDDSKDESVCYDDNDETTSVEGGNEDQEEEADDSEETTSVEDEDHEEEADEDTTTPLVTTVGRQLRSRTAANPLPLKTTSKPSTTKKIARRPISLEDALNISKEEPSDAIREECRLHLPHEAKESILIEEGENRKITDIVATWTRRLMWDGFLQFSVEKFKGLSKRFFKTFLDPRNVKCDQLRINPDEKEPVQLSIQHVWRVSQHIFITCTTDGDDVFKILPCLKKMTMGEIYSVMDRFFGGATPELREERFWHKLYQLPIDPDRTGLGMMMPYINIYKYYDMEDSKERARFDLNKLENPLRKEMRRTQYGYPKNNTGITDCMTYIGFPGSFFCAHVEDSDYNSCNFSTGGDLKVWNVVSGFYYKKLVEKLKAHIASLKLKEKDVLRVYNTDCQLHHKRVLIGPRQLELWEIDFTIVRQKPGDLLVLGSTAMHQGCNLSLNAAFAVNTVCGDYHLLAGEGVMQCDHPYRVPHIGETEPDLAHLPVPSRKKKLKRYKSTAHTLGKMMKHSANIHYKGLGPAIDRAEKLTEDDLSTHKNPITETLDAAPTGDEEFHDQLRSCTPSPTLGLSPFEISSADEEEENDAEHEVLNPGGDSNEMIMGLGGEGGGGRLETEILFPPNENDIGDDVVNAASPSVLEKTASQPSSVQSTKKKSTIRKKTDSSAAANPTLPSTASSSSRPKGQVSESSTVAPTKKKRKTKFAYNLQYWKDKAVPLTPETRLIPVYLDADQVKVLNDKRPKHKQLSDRLNKDRYKCPSCTELFLTDDKCREHIELGVHDKKLYGMCTRPGCTHYLSTSTIIRHMNKHWEQEEEANLCFHVESMSFSAKKSSDPSIKDLNTSLKAECEKARQREADRIAKGKNATKKTGEQDVEEGSGDHQENESKTTTVGAKRKRQMQQEIPTSSSSGNKDDHHIASPPIAKRRKVPESSPSTVTGVDVDVIATHTTPSGNNEHVLDQNESGSTTKL